MGALEGPGRGRSSTTSRPRATTRSPSSTRWTQLAVADDFLGPRFALGAGTDLGGDEWVYLTQLDTATGELPARSSLTAFDLGGASAWTTTIDWDRFNELDSTGVRASDEALYEVVIGQEIGDGLPRPHLVHRDLEGETVCIADLDEFGVAEVHDFRLLGSTRALADVRWQVHSQAPAYDALVVLRIGWSP